MEEIASATVEVTESNTVTLDDFPDLAVDLTSGVAAGTTRLPAATGAESVSVQVAARMLDRVERAVQGVSRFDRTDTIDDAVADARRLAAFSMYCHSRSQPDRGHRRRPRE